VPLQIVTLLGIIYMIFAIGLSIQVLGQYFTGESLEGFTTVIILLLIIGGTMLISLGIIGLYIGKIYQEMKGRPTYIVMETMNNEKN
jgi:polyisoprenyl-phosphate glycosyltransferase